MNSIVFPNYIVTNGKLSKDILVKRGIPEKKVIDGPSLRQRIPKYIKNSKRNNKNNLLLVLSLSISHSIEMINHINSLYNNKLKKLGINTFTNNPKEVYLAFVCVYHDQILNFLDSYNGLTYDYKKLDFKK